MIKNSQRLSQQRAVHKWNNAHYDAIKVYVPKGQREVIKAAATEAGLSVNGFICTAIREAMRAAGVELTVRAEEEEETEREQEQEKPEEVQ